MFTGNLETLPRSI